MENFRSVSSLAVLAGILLAVNDGGSKNTLQHSTEDILKGDMIPFHHHKHILRILSLNVNVYGASTVELRDMICQALKSRRSTSYPQTTHYTRDPPPRYRFSKEKGLGHSCDSVVSVDGTAMKRVKREDRARKAQEKAKKKLESVKQPSSYRITRVDLPRRSVLHAIAFGQASEVPRIPRYILS